MRLGEGGRLEQGEGGWGGGGVPGLEGGQKAGRKRWRPAASRSAPKESAAGAGPQVLTLAELAHKGHRSRLRGPLGSGGRSFLIKHTRGASGGCVLCRARGGTHTICWDVVWLLWLTPWFHTSVAVTFADTLSKALKPLNRRLGLAGCTPVDRLCCVPFN